MRNYLESIERLAKTNKAYITWNSVSRPFDLWPSLHNEGEWDTQPDLKLKRYTMWWTLSKQLSDLKVSTLIDIGTASGQFVLCCLLAGIEQSYGIDPREYYLYSNNSDFTTSKYEAAEHLSIGDIESFIEVVNSSSSFEVDCISLLNFFHGDDWNGRDLEYLKAINGKVKYLATSNPKNVEAFEYLHNNYDVVYHYKQVAAYEDHFILKSKTK